MSGFDLDWLRLRNRFDEAALAPALAKRFAQEVGPQPRLLELGCGSGANLRHLAPQLGVRQSWLMLDRDESLLAAVEPETRAWADQRGWLVADRGGSGFLLEGEGREVHVQLRQADLAEEMDAVPWTEVDAVTGSALLDLTSGDWLDGLAAALLGHRLSALFVLSFDGRLRWRPTDPADREIEQAFRKHQTGDKGFGPAKGPDAPEYLARALRRPGWTVVSATSDWRIPPTERAMLEAMIGGVTTGACEAEPGRAKSCRAWAANRLAQAGSGRVALVVGHVDLLALPQAG